MDDEVIRNQKNQIIKQRKRGTIMSYTEVKTIDADKLAEFMHNASLGSVEKQEATLNAAEVILLITDNEKWLNELERLPNNAAKLSFLGDKVLARRKNERQEKLDNATYIFDTIQSSRDDFETALSSIRGIVFDSNKVTENGIRCDSNGNPAEDAFYQEISGRTIKQWGITKYLDDKTGLLSDKPTSNSEPVRVMYVNLPGNIQVEITHTDIYKVGAGIKRDIAAYPTMLPRYAAGSGEDKNTGDNTGATGQFRNIIAEAATETPYPEYSRNKMLSEMIDKGHIQCVQHLMIGTLEVLRHFNATDLLALSNEDVERYLEIIYNASVVDESEQKAIFDDTCLDSYLDDTGAPLNGMDDNNNVITGNANTHEAKRKYLVWLGQQAITNLHKVLVVNNASVHALQKKIISTYGNAMSK